MEHFLQGTAPKLSSTEGYFRRDTANYVEIKILLEDTWFPVYIVTFSETICAAVTCWNEQWDSIFDAISRPGVEKIGRKIWPTMFQCIDNAIRERYGDGALVELLDPDVMSRKWIVAVLFSPLAEDESEVAQEAVDRVLQISLNIAKESERSPSKLDYARVAATGAFQRAAKSNSTAELARHAAQHWLSIALGQ